MNDPTVKRLQLYILMAMMMSLFSGLSQSTGIPEKDIIEKFNELRDKVDFEFSDLYFHFATNKKIK